jgi:peptidoglycan biosynthesis protein MviN/MurJ (putative lipid II flippase)
VFHWGVWALGLSYAITSLTDMCVLLYLLDKKVGGFDRERAIVPFAKIVYATLFMGITLYLPIKLLDQVIIDTSKTLNLLLLTGIAGMCGIGFYLLFTKILRVEEIQLLYTLLRKLKLSPASKSIVEPLAQETQA